jgi:hypothetical protein
MLAIMMVRVHVCMCVCVYGLVWVCHCNYAADIEAHICIRTCRCGSSCASVVDSSKHDKPAN